MMKFTTTKVALVKAIAAAGKAASSKGSLPILECLLLDAKGDTLTLTGSNLDITISVPVEVDLEQPGKIAINKKSLMEFVSKLPDGNVYIEQRAGEVLSFQYGLGSETCLKGVCADEYPEMINVDEKNKITIKGKQLKQMLRQVLPAISTEEIKPFLTGVLFEAKSTSLNLVALDGFRMVISSTTLQEAADVKILPPGKHLEVVMALIDDGDVEIYSSQNNVLFKMGAMTVTSRMIEGEFINYKQIIPTEQKISAKVKTEQLLECVDRAAIISAEASNKVITLNFTEKKLEIVAEGPYGKADEQLDAEIKGEIEIGFNSKFLLDCIKAVDEEEVLIEASSPISPVTLKPIKAEGTFTALILPCRLKPTVAKADKKEKKAA